jgi:hypothetical protein
MAIAGALAAKKSFRLRFASGAYRWPVRIGLVVGVI